MQFLNDGTLAPFNPGTPTATANAAIGGDGGYTHNEWLLPTVRTAQGFARLDWNFSDSVKRLHIRPLFQQLHIRRQPDLREHL